MGQGVVHILGTHLIQGGIPDGVLFGKQVCQELHGRDGEKRAVECVAFVVAVEGQHLLSYQQCRR